MKAVKKIIGIQILFILLLFVPKAHAQAETQDLNSLFLTANQNYQNGRYQEAAAAYATILKSRENGYLYFNLGNCYLKMTRIGQAILNYRRAQKFIPRFADLSMNLEYAQQETKDKIESKGYSQLLQTVFFWYYRLNKRELIISFLVINFLFFLLASIKIYTQTDAVNWLLIVVGIIYILSAGSTGAKLYQDKFTQSGVVTEDEVEVRSGNNLQSVVLFKLHAGTELTVQEVDTSWLKITLPDGKIGWAQKKGIGII